MFERLRSRAPWITTTVVGIVLATFFSDFSHEMFTAILPLYLAGLGLGPAALGWIEGVADLLGGLSKLAGGVAGHRLARKRPLTALGYLITSLATAAMGLVNGAAALVTLRSVAWMGRGFRGPLRDYLLSDAVEKTHYARAYGVERAGDMLGAMVGPLVASALVWGGSDLRRLILWTLVPGVAAAAAIHFLVRERAPLPPSAPGDDSGERARLPRAFWILLCGVFLFGIGDFSRTFLIWLAARAFGEEARTTTGALSLAVLLYTLHNLLSAAAALVAGHLGDRGPKLRTLLGGYSIGVATNVLLAFFSESAGWLVAAVCLSAVYIAIEETLEKGVAAELLPRELRSLGFGILAGSNSVGDMVSSIAVGSLLAAGRPGLAFGLSASAGALGVAWLAFARRGALRSSERA